MFESFVIGPIAGERLGIVRQCLDCRAAAGPEARACQGFGPGCLTTPRATAKAFELREPPLGRWEAP